MMIRGSETIIKQLPNMTKEQLICVIKAHKQIKTNMSGYSSMKVQDLRTNLEKALKNEKPLPRKKVESQWAKALKTYNEGKTNFTIPKKGTNEHQKVLEIMAGKKAMSTLQDSDQGDDGANDKEEVIRPRRGRPKKREEVKPVSMVERDAKQTRSRVRP